MGNLEHNIKEAFVAQDAKTKMTGKSEMWNRLNNQMHKGKGVAAFWRVAAIFLGLLLTAGVFAAISNRAKNLSELEKLKNEKTMLQGVVDSLYASSGSTAPKEMQVIEKEKIVYHEKVVYREKPIVNPNLEAISKVLRDSLTQQRIREKDYIQEIENLKIDLLRSGEELMRLQAQIPGGIEQKNTAPFELKSEQIQLEIQKEPAVKNPEMEMKVFQKSFIENRNNLNKNILRK